MSWNPWRALRDRAHTVLRWQELDGADGLVEVDRWGRETVILDHRLRRRERRATLAHELVHLERGVLPGDVPRLLSEKDEAATRRETAARLVPLDELLALIDQRSSVGAITVDDIADHFDVPRAVAQERCDALRRSPPGRVDCQETPRQIPGNSARASP